MATQALPHPLASLSEAEYLKALETVRKYHGADTSLYFRAIHLQEPNKADLIPFLEAEHAGSLTEETKRPARQAAVEHDVRKVDRYDYTLAIVDLGTGEVVHTRVAEKFSEPYVTPDEFMNFQDACLESQLWKDAISEFVIPEGFTICIEPWPYGPPDDHEEFPRYMQGLIFAKDVRNNNADSNHYAYPIPIMPVMDWFTKKLLRVERLATGGAEDGLAPLARETEPKKLFHNSHAAEYIPELLNQPMRTDLKPLNVVQPEGASFSVHPDGLIEWQKWRFRLGVNPREGAVLHDVCYDNRPIVYRLSYSELTVPYADPRPPYPRKQAFDFGDGGMGRAANNLELGCDCLGAIHYVDTLSTYPDGSFSPAKSVVCLHEQDNGILWKHTNYRTGRAAVTRNREFVVQFIATLANYEYVFAYKLDLAGGITIETRATGIMSVVPIDEGKTSTYGNVVAPGILAQNHQHIFAVRIDPAIDSYQSGDTQVVVEETHGVKMNPETNPYGNAYKIQREKVEKATWIDAEPRLNRLLKLENTSKKNSISGKNVGYKLGINASQMLISDNDGIHARRARYAQHNAWVTGHRDGEFWAAGEFTNQSKREVGGVSDMVVRGDWFSDDSPGTTAEKGGKKSSPVIWSVLGLTHNPRIEDWPVMPVEIHQMHLRPADFFTSNPALDVPSTKNSASVLVPCCGTAQQDPLTHKQGSAPEIDAKEAGIKVDSGNRLSRTLSGLTGLLKLGKDSEKEK